MTRNESKTKKRFDVSRQQAAAMLSVSVQTISNYVAEGMLTVRRHGRFMYLCSDEVKQLNPMAKDMVEAKRKLQRAQKIFLKKCAEYQQGIRQVTIDSRFRDDIQSKINSEIVKGILACIGNEDIFEQKTTHGRKVAAVCKDYFSGMHVPVIAKKHGISREGVRQIVKKGVRRMSVVGTYPELIKTIRSLRQEVLAQKDVIATLKSQNAEVRVLAGLRPADSHAQFKEEIMNKSIYDLGLSVRAQNCCRKAGIATVRGLCQYTYDEVKSMRLVGAKTVDELSDVLTKYGLSFRQHKNRFVGV